MKRYYYIKVFFMMLFFASLFIGSCSTAPQSTTSVKEVNKVLTGLDILSQNNFDALNGRRVGLITNQTGVDRNLIQNIDLFKNSGNVNLRAVFSPEHGFKGSEEAGKVILDTRDSITGLRFYSLYGKEKSPTAEMLKDIDILVFDIQDIGIRSYTYISTMGLAMDAAAKNGVEFLVLDRPNPLGGIRVEGNSLDMDYQSFIGMYPIPYVYGLTSGELATFINEKPFISKKKCDLKVIKMLHWSRKKSFKETFLNWVPTSPHVPNDKTPYFMVATGILGELGVFSIGVGYTIPFQTIAAPWINSQLISVKMNELKLKGVTFRPIDYSPYYSLYSGRSVGGVQIHITDYNEVDLYSIQFYFLQVHHILYPDKNPFSMAKPEKIKMYDKAMGTSAVRKIFMIENTHSSIRGIIKQDIELFHREKKQYHLYE